MELNSNNRFLAVLTGAGAGTAVFADTTLHTLNINTIIPREATVIEELWINGVDVMAAGNSDNPYNLQGVTLYETDVVVRTIDHPIQKVKLASGSVRVHLEPTN